MIVTAAGRTHTGTSRSSNQDAMLLGDHAIARASDQATEISGSLDRPLLLAVADGVGGHAGGEHASATVVTRLAEWKPVTRDALESALGEIHAELKRLGKQPETWALGSTFCCVLLGTPSIGAAIGDGFVAISSGRVVRPLAMTWDDIASSSTINAALGGGEQTSDVLALRSFPVLAESGARYILASDGLIRAIEYEVFRTIVKSASTPREALDGLLNVALNGGAPDNITCIIADIADIADSKEHHE